MDIWCFISKSFRGWQKHWREKGWMNERALPGQMYEPTAVEHFANTLSHGVMIIPSIIAGEILIYTATNARTEETNIDANETVLKQSIQYEVSARTYTCSFVALFIISTIYHWVSWTRCVQKKEHRRASVCCCGTELWELFHMCDRTVIFIFIAGSYTPWLLLADVPSHVEWLKWGIWVYAVVGTAYSYVFLEKYKLLETIIYVIIGLGPAMALSSTLPAHQLACLETLRLGGFFYLSGILIFKSDGFVPFAHALWHVFVVLGAIAHFVSIYSHLYIPAYNA